jgi:hypothetical protein
LSVKIGVQPNLPQGRKCHGHTRHDAMIAQPIPFPAVARKKVTPFDGGRLTSDGGVLLLAQAERAMGICRRLAACIADPRIRRG